MKKVYLTLAIISICSTGCTTSYRVYVNGFSEIDKPLKENASILVIPDVNSRNPVMDNRTKNRIEQLLQNDGYRPADSNGRYDYILTFEGGLDTYRTLEYEPFYNSHVGFYGGHHTGYGFGFTTYHPYYETDQTQWLVMRLKTPAEPAVAKSEKVIWVGEAFTDTGGEDRRIVTDYLLVGCLEYLGIETGRQKSSFITEKDPRIMLIASPEQ
jgi:hypothetical protein